MSKTISQRELRNDSAAVLRAVEAGESFIVTRNGVPLAELVPVKKRTFVPRDELAVALRSLAPLDAAAFRTDLERHLDLSHEPRA